MACAVALQKYFKQMDKWDCHSCFTSQEACLNCWLKHTIWSTFHIQR